MDEDRVGFPIPSNKSVFDEGDVDIEARPMPQSDFIMSFANDDGTKAVILTSIEDLGDGTVERHGREELEQYAQALMDTGDDPFGLQIGDVFEGETAGADAEAEAFRLAEDFDPGEGATDEELIAAVNDAAADATVVGAPMEDTFPVGVEEAPDIDVPDEDIGAEVEPVEPVEEEEEPMLKQLNKLKGKK